MSEKVISHTKRYRVDYYDSGRWYEHSSHSFLWRAKKVARYRISLGIFEYRVVDTHA